jgi:hypothetical protein
VSLQSQKDWRKWFAENYEALIEAAAYCPEPNELVHHTFMRVDKVCDAKAAAVMRKPTAYFKAAMWTEYTRGQYHKKHKLRSREHVERIQDRPFLDDGRLLKLERIEIVLDRLPWFEQTVMRLYIDGWNMQEVAQQTGINPTVLYNVVNRTKKLLKYVYSKK